MKVYSPSFLAASAAFVFLASGFKILTAVHTYCEDRWTLAGLALAAVVIASIVIRNWPTGAKRAISVLTLTILFLTAAGNLWFVAWATHTCVTS